MALKMPTTMSQWTTQIRIVKKEASLQRAGYQAMKKKTIKSTDLTFTLFPDDETI
jgi:hypothetical protein